MSKNKMKKTLFNTLLLSLLIMIIPTIVVAEDHHNEPEKTEAYNPTPQILHHIADSYEWHLWGNVSIPLPVILYTEGNLDVFISSKFHHGESKVV